VLQGGEKESKEEGICKIETPLLTEPETVPLPNRDRDKQPFRYIVELKRKSKTKVDI
jgi:hypothetical protein